MFYAKNVPGWERMLRVIAGLAMIAFGLLGLPGQVIGYAFAAGGVVAALTGFVGFCPMCALVGRKLDAERRRA
jgi:Protein of unknown function (DUF2892)